MKILIKLYICSILTLSFTEYVKAQSISKIDKDSLERIVQKYYSLNLTTFQANSTLEDIDRIFDLFDGDFEYVHPKYGGVYSRDDLYKGYVRNQKKGDYNGEIVDIIIKNKIVGLNLVVVERMYLFKNDQRTKEGESQVTLFEFKNGKISRIFEYW